MSPTPPTPDDVHSANFFVQWWQHILAGSIIILTGWLLKLKGRDQETAIIPMSEEEIEHRLTICKQSILISMQEELNARDEKLFRYIEEQDEKTLDHIRDIINNR